MGLSISIVLNLVYCTSSLPDSNEGISEFGNDSSLDEIISSIKMSSFSPDEHNLFIVLRGKLVDFLSCVNRTIVSR